MGWGIGWKTEKCMAKKPKRTFDSDQFLDHDVCPNLECGSHDVFLGPPKLGDDDKVYRKGVCEDCRTHFKIVYVAANLVQLADADKEEDDMDVEVEEEEGGIDRDDFATFYPGQDD
jgi:hypothetical protein